MNVPTTTQDVFGWLGGGLSLIYNIPQIYHLYKTKKSNDLSLQSWILRLISYCFYIIHVWIRKDPALFYTYAIGFLQCCIITGQIFVYKSECNKENGVPIEPKSKRATDSASSSSNDDGV